MDQIKSIKWPFPNQSLLINPGFRPRVKRYGISIKTSSEENGMKRLLSSRKDASRDDVSEPYQGVLRRPNPL